MAGYVYRATAYQNQPTDSSRQLNQLRAQLLRTQRRLEEEQAAHEKTKASAEVPTAQLTELTAERDSLVTANQSLKTLHQVQERTINELRAKIVQVENPSVVKALQEELEACKKATAALAHRNAEISSELKVARGKLRRHQDPDAGLVATIADDGVTMHGHLAEGSTYEQRAAVLNRAVNLLVFTPTPE